LVVLYVIWRRTHLAPTVGAVGAANPFGALPGNVGAVAGLASSGLSAANQALDTATGAVPGLVGQAAKLGVKTAALPLTLSYSAARATVDALNPFSWGGDSASTKQRKEIQRQQAALKNAPQNQAAYNASMVSIGRPDLQVDNSAYTNYIASNGIDQRAYYIP
jgi:hypothetical protein